MSPKRAALMWHRDWSIRHGESWAWGRSGTGAARLRSDGCGDGRVPGPQGVGTAWLGWRHGWGGHGTGVVGGRWWEPHQLLMPAAETTGGMAAGGCCEAAPQPQNPILDAQLRRLCGRRALLGGGCNPSLGSALGGIGAAARRGRQELCCPPQKYHSGVGWTLENVPGHEAEVPASSQHLHGPWRREQIHRRRR